MAIVIPNGYAIVSFGGFITGDDEEMFWTIGSDYNPSTPDPVQWCHDAFDQWVTSFGGEYSMDWSFFSCRVRANDAGGAGDISAEYTEAGVAGQHNNTVMPPNVSVLMKKTSALGGRKNRGRAYLAGAVAHDQVSASGIIGGGQLAALQDDADGFLTGWAALDDRTGLYILHGDATPPTLINSLQIETKIATQRRRLRK